VHERPTVPTRAQQARAPLLQRGFKFVKHFINK
jgi:hypothetical protein